MRAQSELGTTVAVETGTRATLRARTSWGAIWAGFFVALGVEFLLTLLMIGIFASMVHPGGGTPSGTSFGIGIALWIFFETIAAFFCGGWVAGKLAGKGDGVLNAVHGSAVWGITTAVLLYLLVAMAGSAVNGALNVVRGAFGIASTATHVTAAAAGTAASSPIASKVLSQNPATADAARYLKTTGDASVLTRFLSESNGPQKSADRTALVKAVSRENHVSTAQASTIVDRWQTQAQNVGNSVGKAANVAGQVAQTAGGVAVTIATWVPIFFFITLIVSLGTALAGAWVSAPRTESAREPIP